MNSKSSKINVIDVIAIILIIAAVIFLSLKIFTDGSLMKSASDKVELTFTPETNEYADSLQIGDEIYISECSSILGKVSSIYISDDGSSVSFKVLASFPQSIPVYSVDGVAVTRGTEYNLRSLNYTCKAKCTGVRVASKAVEKSNAEG